MDYTINSAPVEYVPKAWQPSQYYSTAKANFLANGSSRLPMYVTGPFGYIEPYPDAWAPMSTLSSILQGHAKSQLAAHRAAVAAGTTPEPADLWHIQLSELSLLGYEYKWAAQPTEAPDDQLDRDYTTVFFRAQMEREARLFHFFPQVNAKLGEIRGQLERGEIDLATAKALRRAYIKAVNANLPATGMVSPRLEPAYKGAWKSFATMAPTILTIVAIAVTVGTLLPASPTLAATVPGATGAAAADAAAVEAAASLLPTASGEMASAVAALGVEAPAVSAALATAAPAAGSSALLGTIASEVGGVVSEVGATAAALAKTTAAGAVLAAVGLDEPKKKTPAPEPQLAAEPGGFSPGLVVGGLIVAVIVFFVGMRINA